LACQLGLWVFWLLLTWCILWLQIQIFYKERLRNLDFRNFNGFGGMRLVRFWSRLINFCFIWNNLSLNRIWFHILYYFYIFSFSYFRLILYNLCWLILVCLCINNFYFNNFIIIIFANIDDVFNFSYWLIILHKFSIWKL
jgi:hypothetical protein